MTAHPHYGHRAGRAFLAASIAGLLFLAAASARAGQDNCLVCHNALDDAASKALAKSVHGPKGVSCADCHGGNRGAEDMEKSMSKGAGFVAKPSGAALSKLCGKCHDDAAAMRGFGSSIRTGQSTALQASVHGAGKDGQPLLQCSTCHGSHDIKRGHDASARTGPLQVVALCSGCHSDPTFMRRYNPSLATDQLSKYRTSVHGQKNAKGDTKAATCVSCHSAHGIRRATDATASTHATNLPSTCGVCHSNAEYMRPYGIPTDQVAEFTGSVHGLALLKKGDHGAPSCNSCHGNHGAVPPGVASISNVCGTCHALNAELFRGSRHNAAFTAKGLPECETCHGKHGIRPADIAMLGGGAPAVCARCHDSGKSPEGYKAAIAMRSMLDKLMSTIGEADSLLNNAEQKGMEIEDYRFSLRDARQARLQARTAVHGFDIAAFRTTLEPGQRIADDAKRGAAGSIEEFFFRRWGLAVATLIITLFAVALYLTIKRIERRQAASTQT